MKISVFRPFKSGFKCTCGAAASRAGWDECKCPDEWRRKEYAIKFLWKGKQVMRSTGLTDGRTAKARGKQLADEFVGDSGDIVLQALNMAAKRRVFSSVAEIEAAYDDPSDVLIKDDKQRRRNVLSLRLVLAWSLDLWMKNPSGPARQNGVPIGGDIANRDRIGALSAGVFTAQLVKDYLRNASGGVADYSTPRAENRTINKTLMQARAVFSKRTVALKFGKLALPNLDGFMKHPLLPELSVLPEPVKGTEFAAMLEAVGKLPEGDVRRTINLILRQTGMRSGSIMALHKNWLEKFEDGYTLHVRTVKGGTAEYSIPVSDEVAAVILEREGYTLPGDEKERRKAVEMHSTWVKTVIGETSSRSEQGNHRLRDTVASIAFSWLNRDAAVEMLGNGREVNKKHYAKLRINVTEAMKHELRAVKRLSPGNVLSIVGAAVPAAAAAPAAANG